MTAARREPADASLLERPGFGYRSSRHGLLRRGVAPALHCEDVPLTRLAERHGTPLYVYSASAIRQRLRAFQNAFRGVPHTLCFSVKANSTIRILRMIAQAGGGFDVVSGGELERVRRASRRALAQTVFSGVGKTATEMLLALRSRILLFNVESESELWALAECAALSKCRAPVALRVNPDVPASTHPYISTGVKRHKFGVPMEDARRLYAQASGSRHLRVAGVSVHIGSQITDLRAFSAALQRVAELVSELKRDGHVIEFVDAGGGLGIDYQAQGAADYRQPISDYAEAIAKPLRGLGVRLLLEPGRFIVGPAGVLLTRVIYRKNNGGKTFLVVDAAMNDLLRPSLYGAYHGITPVLNQERGIEDVDVVGPICETGDFLAQGRKLPITEEGELLAIMDTGAYGMSLASNYNSRPRAAEVLVSAKSAQLIRRRETVKDLLATER